MLNCVSGLCAETGSQQVLRCFVGRSGCNMSCFLALSGVRSDGGPIKEQSNIAGPKLIKGDCMGW